MFAIAEGRGWFAVVLVLGVACGTDAPLPPPKPAPVAVTPARPAPPPVASTTTTRPTSPPKQTPPDAKAVAEASELARRGLEAYQQGRYDEAEGLLKRSITLHPFLAQANLGLGKIFLLRGAAAHDEALIDSARLMFQMAHNNDPSLREPEILLQLFDR